MVGVFKLYKNIMFNWKGETKTIGEIYLNITSIVLNPYYIYDFFYLNFKFVAAALFYELQHLEYDIINNEEKSKDMCEIFVLFNNIISTQTSLTEFETLHITIEYLNSLYNNCDEMTEQEPVQIQKNVEEKEISKLIEDQLKHSGIVFDSETKPITPNLKFDVLERIHHLIKLFKLVDNFFFNLSKLTI